MWVIICAELTGRCSERFVKRGFLQCHICLSFSFLRMRCGFHVEKKPQWNPAKRGTLSGLKADQSKIKKSARAARKNVFMGKKILDRDFAEPVQRWRCCKLALWDRLDWSQVIIMLISTVEAYLTSSQHCCLFTFLESWQRLQCLKTRHKNNNEKRIEQCLRKGAGTCSTFKVEEKTKNPWPCVHPKVWGCTCRGFSMQPSLPLISSTLSFLLLCLCSNHYIHIHSLYILSIDIFVSKLFMFVFFADLHFKEHMKTLLDFNCIAINFLKQTNK